MFVHAYRSMRSRKKLDENETQDQVANLDENRLNMIPTWLNYELLENTSANH